MPGADVWYPQCIALIALFMVGVSIFLWKFDKAISLFSIMCLLSAIFVTKLNMKAMFITGEVYLAGLAMYGISNLTVKKRKIVCWAIIGLILLQGAWVILQANGIDPLFTKVVHGKVDYSSDDTVGFSGSHNQLGVFFATTAPIAVGVCPVLLPLVLFGLFCSTTSFAFVGFTVASIVYLFLTKHKLRYFTLVILLCGAAVFFTKYDKNVLGHLHGRIAPAKVGFEAMLTGHIPLEVKHHEKILGANTWTGYGLGSTSKVLPLYKENRYFNRRLEKYTHFHNDYIELIFEFGRLGLAILVFFLVSFFREFKRYRNKELCLYFCCLLAYMLCSMGVFANHVAMSGMFFVLFYGLFKGVVHEQKRAVKRASVLV